MDSTLIDQIYLKLLKIKALLDDNVSSSAKHYKFNKSELKIYLDIKTHPNTDLNSLCARLGLKKSNASKAISKLIKDNVITSEMNPEDNRRLVLKHVELENENICKESFLQATFSGLEQNHCDLGKINDGLDETIKLFSAK